MASRIKTRGVMGVRGLSHWVPTSTEGETLTSVVTELSGEAGGARQGFGRPPRGRGACARRRSLRANRQLPRAGSAPRRRGSVGRSMELEPRESCLGVRKYVCPLGICGIGFLRNGSWKACDLRPINGAVFRRRAIWRNR